jgi:hypothetical protein
MFRYISWSHITIQYLNFIVSHKGKNKTPAVQVCFLNESAKCAIYAKKLLKFNTLQSTPSASLKEGS